MQTITAARALPACNGQRQRSIGVSSATVFHGLPPLCLRRAPPVLPSGSVSTLFSLLAATPPRIWINARSHGGAPKGTRSRSGRPPVGCAAQRAVTAYPAASRCCEAGRHAAHGREIPLDLPMNGGHPVKGVKSPWEVHHGKKAARLHPRVQGRGGQTRHREGLLPRRGRPLPRHPRDPAPFLEAGRREAG